jgi:two-component system cell cycle sensor histidine kinase PleC
LIAAEELLGKARWDVAGNDLDPELWAAHRADLEAHRPFRDFHFSRTDATGKRWHLRLAGKPVFDDNGAFIGYRGTTVDETDRLEAPAAVRIKGGGPRPGRAS